jgi:hypothetical protein
MLYNFVCSPQYFRAYSQLHWQKLAFNQDGLYYCHQSLVINLAIMEETVLMAHVNVHLDGRDNNAKIATEESGIGICNVRNGITD